MSPTAVLTRPTSELTDDGDLVAAVRTGDDRAFEVLYERYQRRICGYVRGMVHDHGRAEDITQDVFVSALRRMRETDRDIAFKPWIYEIAKNACIDAFRRTRRTDEVSFDAQDAIGAGDQRRLADRRETPDAALDTKQKLDDLRGAFGGLSQTHHDILVMRELEGLSYREIGERLGMSRASVESTLFRARRRLTEEYDDLVSGKRCVRVQGIIAAAGAAAVGARDQRRMALHISHCQPCRRRAVVAGVDLTAPERSVAARIAGFLPLPAFLKRRWDDDGGLLGSHAASSPVTQWSAHVATSVDPGTAGGWSKAVAGAAAVALGSLGAGSAIEQRDLTPNLLERAPIAQQLRDVDARAVLGARSASEAGGADADVAPAGASSEPEGGGGSVSGVPERERRSSQSGASQGGTSSRPAGSSGAGAGAGTGATPGAALAPQRRGAPNLNDVTDRIGLTGSAKGDGGEGSDGAPAGSGAPSVDRPLRDLLEGTLGLGGVSGGGSRPGDGGGAQPNGAGAGSGSTAGAASGTAGAVGATTSTAPTPDAVGQIVTGLNDTLSAALSGG